MSSPKLLLGDALAPVTSEVGFLQAPLDQVVAEFVRWQESIPNRLWQSLRTQPVSGDLEHLLGELLPLTDRERRRYLFLPTADPTWTAYLDNGWQGSDVFAHVGHLAGLLGVRGVRAAVVPHTVRRGRLGGRYGAVILELYGDEKTHLPGVERVVSLLNDGGRWRFEELGPPLPFEKVENYGARRVPDRFPPELLADYLAHLGVDAFSRDFYAPTGVGSLIEKQGPTVPGLRSYSLEEARANY